MNLATRTTLLMLVTAVVATVVAMYFYPWPELVETDVEIGKPLFEEYSADQVRGIEIVDFDNANGNLERIKLIRSREKWILPARQNFIATNSQLIGTVINSLNDKVIYDVMSENQEDHIKYGVVDPAEFSSEKNVASLGRRLVLTDRNNKTIASLIVGLPVKNNPAQRYVRAPGKPRVYLIDFNDQILTTQFPNWISPDALRLRGSDGASVRKLRSIEINNYLISGGNGDAIQQDYVYRALLRPLNQRLEVESLLVPDSEKNGSWKKLLTTPEQQTKLSGSVAALFSLFPDDVRRKKKQLALALQKPSAATPKEVLDELGQFGFYRTGFAKDRWTFDAEHGEVSVATEDGVITSVYIGKVGGANSRGKGKLNHFVMIDAGVDFGSLKEPVRPEGLPDDESEENKEFRRRYDAWQKAVESAERLARQLNAIHGDWIYLISEEIINVLRPEIPLPSLGATNADSEPGSADSIGDDEPGESDSEADGSSDTGGRS